MYAYQRRQLQMLNWRNPGEHWCLKAPAHMWSLDAIGSVFPDARFVWCHRHPLPVIASINSMNRQVMKMYAGDCSHLDAREIGRAVMEWYASSLEQGLATRAQMPEELFVDCSQAELSAEPMAVVERIYSRFGLELAPDSRAAVQAYVDANPKGKHGKHSYELESFGLTEEEVLARFAFYLEDDRWPLSD